VIGKSQPTNLKLRPAETTPSLVWPHDQNGCRIPTIAVIWKWQEQPDNRR